MQNCLYELAKRSKIWNAGKTSTLMGYSSTYWGRGRGGSSTGFQEGRPSGSQIGSRGSDGLSIAKKRARWDRLKSV